MKRALNCAHCSCLLLSLSALLVLGALTYDCLNDCKIGYTNIDDSLDWECGWQYVRIGKDWDSDGDDETYNHSLKIINLFIEYVENDTSSYDLYYDSNTCSQLGTFIENDISKYLFNETSQVSSYSTNDICTNTNGAGILWLVFSSLTLLFIVATIIAIIQTLCCDFRPIIYTVMRVTIILSIIFDILAWCLWIIVGDFCSNESYWTQHMCNNNSNTYKCTYSVKIGGSVVFMLVVLLLQIISIVIIFIKVKPDRKVKLLYDRMTQRSQMETHLSEMVDYDPTKTGTTPMQMPALTGSYHPRDVGHTVSAMTLNEHNAPMYTMHASNHSIQNHH